MAMLGNEKHRKEKTKKDAGNTTSTMNGGLRVAEGARMGSLQQVPIVLFQVGNILACWEQLP